MQSAMGFEQNITFTHQSALHNRARQDHLECCVCVSMVQLVAA